MTLWTLRAAGLCSLLLVIGASGCQEDEYSSDSDSNSNSQTHWLAACEADSDCGDLSCICGICTVECEDDRACGDLDGGACAQANQAIEALCQRDLPEEGICLQGCQDDDGCQDGQTCIAGACVDSDDIEPPGDGEALCNDTGGRWDDTACGDYACGVPNDCEAIIPGCDCGAGQNFDPERGCFADDACGDEPPNDEEGLCNETGGRWDDTACGHYECGTPNACEAIIPGCNCGEGQNFDPERGCFADDACGDEPPGDEEALCNDTGGQWDEGACGHYRCGVPNDCRAVDPGCNCGEGQNFDPERGCFADDACSDDPPGDDEGLCNETGGRWTEDTCGHFCGEELPIDCLLPVPSCQCGEGQNFDSERGCFDDRVCEGGGDEEEALCNETGGRWDDTACGHYQCGEPNVCLALIPGCDCGEGQNFDPRRGCFQDDACEGGSNQQDLCEQTDGRWNEGACGHDVCGEPNACRAVIPGCQCGEGRVFNEQEGCIESDACPAREEALCGATDGRWDEFACGHYECGVPNDCEAIIPGCNCGEGRNFSEFFGCFDDEQCEEGGGEEEAVCERTGGRWTEDTCGHFCGEVLPINCLLPVPSCQCGEGQNFDPERGCFDDEQCEEGGSEEEAICQRTGGQWDDTACGHYECGAPNLCEAIIPGCNCGEGQNFDPERGCFQDDRCEEGGSEEEALCRRSGGEIVMSCGHFICGEPLPIQCLIPEPSCDCGPGRSFSPELGGCFDDEQCEGADAQVLCEQTDGRWNEGACGHDVCGEPNACRAVIPGCQCGEGRVFNEREGCIESDACPNREEALCGATDGQWDPNACGHYTCGQPNECDAIDPGCNCGPTQYFDEFFGCRDDNQCRQ